MFTCMGWRESKEVKGDRETAICIYIMSSSISTHCPARKVGWFNHQDTETNTIYYEGITCDFMYNSNYRETN